MSLPNAAALESLFSEHIGPWVLTYGMHSTLAILAALLLVRWLRTSLARERLWKIVLVGPLFTAGLQLEFVTAVALEPAQQPEFSRPPLIASLVSESPMEVEAAQAREWPVGSEAPPASGPLALPTGPPESSMSWTLVLTLAWALLASCAILDLMRRRRRLVRRLAPRERLLAGPLYESLQRVTAEHPISGRVKLTESGGLTSPVALGWSEICVPRTVHAELGSAEQENLLAHELAHLVRHDPVWLIAVQVFERLLFFQPLIRSVRRRLQEEMEFLADSWAIRRTEDPVHMARCLARMAEWVNHDRGALQLGPNMANSPSQLVRRIQAVLKPQDERQARRASRRATFVGVLGLLILSFVGPRVYGARISLGSIEETPGVALMESPTVITGETALQGAGEPKKQSPWTLRVLPGDTLKFSDDRQPELNFTTTVSSQGSIAVPRLGDFLLGNLTRSDIEGILRKRLLKHYETCDLRVKHTPKSGRYHVYGAVRKPGPRERSDGLTVLEAVLAEQAGPGDQDLEHVSLFRPDLASPLLLTLDVQGMLHAGDTTANVILNDGDRLLIPWGPAEPNSLAPMPVFQQYIARFDRSQDKTSLTWDPALLKDDAAFEAWLKQRARTHELASIEAQFRQLVESSRTAEHFVRMSRWQLEIMRMKIETPPGGIWTLHLLGGSLSARHVDNLGETLILGAGPEFPGPRQALHAWLDNVQIFRDRRDALQSERLNPGLRPAHPRFQRINTAWHLLVPASTSDNDLTALMEALDHHRMGIRSVEREKAATMGTPPRIVIHIRAVTSPSTGSAPTFGYKVVIETAAEGNSKRVPFETTELLLLETFLMGMAATMTTDLSIELRHDSIAPVHLDPLLKVLRTSGLAGTVMSKTTK